MLAAVAVLAILAVLFLVLWLVTLFWAGVLAQHLEDVEAKREADTWAWRSRLAQLNQGKAVPTNPSELN